MLIVLVFVASFMVFLIVTLFFPAMQPGQIIFDILGHSQTDYFVAGISGELLVSATINGLIWGVIIILVYSCWKGPAKGTVNLPVWIPGYTTSHNSKTEKKPTKRVEQSFQDGKNQDIEIIVGIGYINGRKLRKIGILTLDDLLQVGYTRTGREYLAQKVGVSYSTIINWLHQAKTHVNNI